MLALAAWLTTGDSGSGLGTVDLPVNLTQSPAHLSVVLAAASLVAATLCGTAALQAATAMQVLNRDRRIPPPLSPHLQSAVRSTLGPAALRALDVENPPEWADISVPDRDELPPGTHLRCTVLVPAHDEEAVLAASLDSLAGQTRRPERVLVIADNCTDATAQVARTNGVEVVETVGNTEKKAGALNQRLALLLPGLEPRDVVMVMDADSTVSPDSSTRRSGSSRTTRT